MKQFTVLMAVFAFTVVGCSNDHLTADQNNNDNTITNNNDNNDNTVTTDQVVIKLRSTQEIAVWAQVRTGDEFFGRALDREECGGDPGYEIKLGGPVVFLASARGDLSMTANTAVSLYQIPQDPGLAWNFWDFQVVMKNLWLLPAYWDVQRFPLTMSEAEGMKYSVSSLVCGLNLEMINLGCANVVPSEFFRSKGKVTSASFTQGEWDDSVLLFGFVP